MMSSSESTRCHYIAVAAGRSEREGNKIGRITTAGVITEFPIPTPFSGPIAIAAGSDGNPAILESMTDPIFFQIHNREALPATKTPEQLPDGEQRTISAAQSRTCSGRPEG